MPWIEAMLRGQKVLARVKDDGSLLDEGGRVEIRYKPKDGKAYRAARGNLAIVAGAAVLPDDTCGPAEAPPEKGAPAKAAPRAHAVPADAWQAFTDGACSGNPGPGGWGYVLRHPTTGKQREGSGGEPDTTNNRMELIAVIQGLSALSKPSLVDLTSDSKYVLDGLREWLPAWKARGWKTAAKKPVKNQDLWQRLDELLATHQVRFHWIRGHTGHAENERCDALAVQAIEELRAR
jgi:ribonuclease HI